MNSSGAIREEPQAAHREKVLFGISMDGVLASGITEEFLKVASIFNGHGYRTYLDLGYDIRSDKGDFFRPYANEAEALPDWLALARIRGLAEVRGYTQRLVREMLEQIRDGDGERIRRCLGGAIVPRIAASIVDTWRRLDVSVVIVENGSLPENLLFSEALRLAIEQYGREKRKGPFVLWRDHDLMWFSESEKYGGPAFEHIPKPPVSKYIRYATLTNTARKRFNEWAPHIDATVLPNCFRFEQAAIDDANRHFRAHYGIPADALLIARCTRVIPQKRLDRDIFLLHALRESMRSSGSERSVYLFVTGPTGEHEEEHGRLSRMAIELGVDAQVIYGNGLLPCSALCRPSNRASREPQYSVGDLLAHADLSSFLTSYDYEGFGNPPAEASAQQRPFISSTYELYDEVYGEKGFKSLLLRTRKDWDGMPDGAYAHAVRELLLDERRRQRWARFNFELGRRHFSLEFLRRRLRACLPGALDSASSETMRDAISA
ncbi:MULTISPECIES: hypothetical protein [Burkholderia]|uniref:hypothetical protein n=2 Tax=Burkholderiaceae TaxID=119060 RepID=UPI001CF7A68A|nr:MULTISPECIES: hypothetical protein [Burkholderia]